MINLRKDLFMVVKHEPNLGAKVGSDPGKEAQAVKSRMDDVGNSTLGTVPDATGYSGSAEED
jgi:hypothetical protein